MRYVLRAFRTVHNITNPMMYNAILFTKNKKQEVKNAVHFHLHIMHNKFAFPAHTVRIIKEKGSE